jgi:hypothetical protein
VLAVSFEHNTPIVPIVWPADDVSPATGDDMVSKGRLTGPVFRSELPEPSGSGGGRGSRSVHMVRSRGVSNADYRQVDPKGRVSYIEVRSKHPSGRWPDVPSVVRWELATAPAPYDSRRRQPPRGVCE